MIEGEKYKIIQDEYNKLNDENILLNKMNQDYKKTISYLEDNN